MRSGTSGPIVWKMDPGQAKIDRNRGAALWGNLVISVTSHDGRVVATDKETGKVVWDKNLRDQPDMTLNAAPLALEDRILIGASGGDQGVRNWLVALDAKTGNELWRFHAIPAPGEPGTRPGRTRTTPGRPAAAPSTSPAPTIPPPTRPIGAPAIRRRNTTSSYRPGDNLYTNSALAIDAATGKLRWYHQYTPNDTMDYDETGTHILIDTKVNGEDRKTVVRAARNGFAYSFDRLSGQFLKATQYVQQGDLDQGHRSQDRQAGRLRSEQGSADLCGADRQDA